MADRTTISDLTVGDKIHRAMRWQRVVRVGGAIPDDGRIPLVLRDVKTGEEREVKIQASAEVTIYGRDAKVDDREFLSADFDEEETHADNPGAGPR